MREIGDLRDQPQGDDSHLLSPRDTLAGSCARSAWRSGQAAGLRASCSGALPAAADDLTIERGRSRRRRLLACQTKTAGPSCASSRDRRRPLSSAARRGSHRATAAPRRPIGAARARTTDDTRAPVRGRSSARTHSAQTRQSTSRTGHPRWRAAAPEQQAGAAQERVGDTAAGAHQGWKLIPLRLTTWPIGMKTLTSPFGKIVTTGAKFSLSV